MALSDIIFTFARDLMARTGYLGIFALMTMESATLPVPSEIVLPLAGYLVYQGTLEFWTAVTAASLGSLLGTMIDYELGFHLGRPGILRYGRWVRLSEHHLARSETWFTRYGNPAVLLARFVPLLRTIIAFPAGISKMNVRKFLAFSTLGIVAWDIILIYLGEVAGQNSTLIINSLESAFVPIEIAAITILLLGLYAFLRKQSEKS